MALPIEVHFSLAPVEKKEAKDHTLKEESQGRQKLVLVARSKVHGRKQVRQLETAKVRKKMDQTRRKDVTRSFCEAVLHRKDKKVSCQKSLKGRQKKEDELALHFLKQSNDSIALTRLRLRRLAC